MSWFRRVAASIARLEPLAVALAAPFLLFPTLWPEATAGLLAVLLVVWLAGWLGTGRPWIRTPLDGALLLLALTIPVAVWASAFPELTLPKLAGLVLGLATFRATVNFARTPRRLRAASAAFLALGLGLVLLGLVGAAWPAKWPVLQPIISRMPRLLGGLPGAEKGIHPNELAGALILFLPLPLARLAGRRPGRAGGDVLARLAALLLAAVLSAMVFLTQSRSAWLGVLAAIGVMAWLRWPRLRWLGLAVLVLASAGLLLLYAGPLESLRSAFALSPPAGEFLAVDGETLTGRLELWSRALYAIQDFPFTGCGLGAFRQVVHLLYPLFTVAPGTDLGHAHNVFLQVALDLGLPGLVAYLALVGIALWMGWRVARSASTSVPSPGAAAGQFQWLGVGIVGGLVAHHVYGLTDTVALGAKPGVALWMLLGLAAALWLVVMGSSPHLPEAS